MTQMESILDERVYDFKKHPSASVDHNEQPQLPSPPSRWGLCGECGKVYLTALRKLMSVLNVSDRVFVKGF